MSLSPLSFETEKSWKSKPLIWKHLIMHKISIFLAQSSRVNYRRISANSASLITECFFFFFFAASSCLNLQERTSSFKTTYLWMLAVRFVFKVNPALLDAHFIAVDYLSSFLFCWTLSLSSLFGRREQLLIFFLFFFTELWKLRSCRRSAGSHTPPSPPSARTASAGRLL